MKRVVVGFALLADLVLLHPTVHATNDSFGFGNNDNTNASATTVSPCEIAGKQWSSGFQYLVGGPGKYPSVYASCNNGVATCYHQTPTRDVLHDAIGCDDATLANTRRRLGLFKEDRDNRWPKGILCYKYDFAFNDQQKDIHRRAMDEYHHKTKLRFMPLDKCKEKFGENTDVCDNCKFGFSFGQITNACYANLGFVPSTPNLLNMGDDCFNDDIATAVHELGHVVGLAHEHVHPERDVVVLSDEITVSPDNYAKISDFAKTGYDRGSVMHYDRKAGLCVPKDKSVNYCDVMDNPNNCVRPTPDICSDEPGTQDFGHSPGLSQSDVDTINKMYGDIAIGDGDGKTNPAQTPAPTPPPNPQPPQTEPPKQTPKPDGGTSLHVPHRMVFSVKKDGNDRLILELISIAK